MPRFDKDVFECLIDKVIIGEIQEDGTINPYTIRFICKNGSEINCRDNFTATGNKQHSNNIATREKQRMLSALRCYMRKKPCTKDFKDYSDANNDAKNSNSMDLLGHS